jgi:FMN phosphatase YigB (HAD superfamily)
MIKGIIFDLDDTLYDCTATVKKSATITASKAMAAVLGIPYQKFWAKRKEIMKDDPFFWSVNKKLCHAFKIKGKKAQKAYKAGNELYYIKPHVGAIKPFSGVKPMLGRLKKKYLLGLVTFGHIQLQQKKLKKLGIKNHFTYIGFDEYQKLGLTKKDCFKEFCKKLKMKPSEVLVVGDNLTNEIAIANKMGMTTIRILTGSRKKLQPKTDYEIPDYSFKKITHVEKFVKKLS